MFSDALQCVGSCSAVDQFTELDARVCAKSCYSSTFKNHTLGDAGSTIDSVETVCIDRCDGENVLFNHSSSDSYLKNSLECRSGCLVPYLFVDLGICVGACPAERLLVEPIVSGSYSFGTSGGADGVSIPNDTLNSVPGGTCHSECPFYNLDDNDCVPSARPDCTFYNRTLKAPYTFRNCTEICPVKYTVDTRSAAHSGHFECVSDCNTSVPFTEGRECRILCGEKHYNESFICGEKCSKFGYLDP